VAGLRLALVVVAALAGCGGSAIQAGPRCTRRELQKASEENRQLRQERDRLRRELERTRQQMKRQKVIVEIARSLQSVRGLPLRRPLRVSWVSEEQARRYMQRDLTREMPPAHAEAYVATLARLGLLPRGYALVDRMMELMGEQVAGFYDPRAGKLFVRADMPAGELILSHEIAHALQDQSFPLKSLEGDCKDHDDRCFAARALVEGDATVTMLDRLRRTLTLWRAFAMLPDLLEALALDDAKIKQAPAYLRESLVQPYLRGMALVQTLLRHGGWARVNRAFRHPPASSEQVLHPDKYLAGEQPLAVAIPDLSAVLGPSTRRLHENTLGEFGISILLGSTAAAGWGGDRLRSYRRPDGKVLLVWHTVWDTTGDADEFAEAEADHLGAPARHAAGGRRVWRSADGLATLTTRGRGVLLVDGAVDSGQAAAIARVCGF